MKKFEATYTTQPHHKVFVHDMEKVELEVQHYDGRFFYHGPAVVVDRVQDALMATKVECCWDHLGLQFIVYPR